MLRTVETGGYDVKTTHATALLLNFSKPKASARTVLELGSGWGVVSIAVAKLYGRKVFGIDIRCDLVKAAEDIARMNGVEDLVRFECCDVRDVKDAVKAESFDMVISNPPHHSKKPASPDPGRKLERSIDEEVMRAFVEATFWSLKNGGEFVFVLSPENLIDWIYELRAKSLEVKKMVFFHPKDRAELVAIRGRKNGKSGLVVEAPILGGGAF